MIKWDQEQMFRIFKSLCNLFHKLILAAKKDYYSNLVSSSSENPKCLWETINKLLNHKSSSLLPSSTPGTSLAYSFASFFNNKISKLGSLFSTPTTSSTHIPSPASTFPDFSYFTPASERQSTRFCQTAPTTIWFRSYVHLASQRMCICAHSYNHKHS